MILAPVQRGLAAGVIAAVFAIGTGPQAMAQGPSSRKPAHAAPAQHAAPAKPAAKGAAKGSAKGSEKPGQAATGPGGATLLASYGDWGVYTAKTGRSEICYALSQPKDRQPKSVSRDPAYLFVSFRPAENVKNEVALVLGYAAKENGPAVATVGKASYALLTKDTNAWLKNPAEESQAIVTMGKAPSLVVKAQSSRGHQLTDRYSLSGFEKALERARKECS